LLVDRLAGIQGRSLTSPVVGDAALLILGMNWALYELKLRSNSYCYSAPAGLLCAGSLQRLDSIQRFHPTRVSADLGVEFFPL